MPRVPQPTNGALRRPATPRESRASAEVLNSWKEIADYMGRTVRTVQRWEHTLNLPVQRPRGEHKNVVFARTNELRRWMEGRGVSDPQRAHLTRANLERMQQLCATMMKQTEMLKQRASHLAEELRTIQRRRSANGAAQK